MRGHCSVNVAALTTGSEDLIKMLYSGRPPLLMAIAVTRPSCSHYSLSTQVLMAATLLGYVVIRVRAAVCAPVSCQDHPPRQGQASRLRRASAMDECDARGERVFVPGARLRVD